MKNAILFLINKDYYIASLRNLNSICFYCKDDYDIFAGFTIFDRTELLPNMVKPLCVYNDLYETLKNDNRLLYYDNVYIINSDLYSKNWDITLNKFNEISCDLLVSKYNEFIRISNATLNYFISNESHNIESLYKKFSYRSIDEYVDFSKDNNYNDIYSIRSNKLITNGYISTNDFYNVRENNLLNPVISIVMPVFNGDKYLNDALDSIINQINPPTYEIVIINDGSIDNTNDIILSYNTKNITYISKKHSGIADSLNLGIKYSKGKYIVRMDSDDIMLLDRLQVQYNYMEANHDVDVAGYKFYYDNTSYDNSIHKILINECITSNPLDCPTAIIRSSSINKYQYFYEDYFRGAENYKLLVTCILRGLNIISINYPVLKKRIHNDQISSTSKYIIESSNRIQSALKCLCKKESSELTVIIPFKNEGYEVERTIWSIKCTAPNVNIILIDDASDDGYPYKFYGDIFNCIYIRNENPKGVGPSRDIGVSNCKTEYFLILDAHMRMYEDNWDIRVLNLIKKNPKSIMFGRTINISKVRDNIYENEHGDDLENSYYGYRFNFDNNEIHGNWCYKIPNTYKNKNIVPIPCIIGACYISSKTWWQYIGGLKGLNFLGYDEELLSLKTWMCGGKILLIRDLYIGHMYRLLHEANYEINYNKINDNQNFLKYMFYDTNINNEYYKSIKDDFTKLIVHDLNWVKKMNKKYY